MDTLAVCATAVPRDDILADLDQPGGAWLELGDGTCLLARRPREVVPAAALDAVIPALRRVEAAAQAGYTAIGYLAYEAAPAFDPALAVVAPPRGSILAWFALYEPGDAVRWPMPASTPAPEDGEATLLGRSLTRADFDRALTAIRAALRAGDVYQVNFTFRQYYTLGGLSPLALFRRLRDAHPVPYAAWLRGEREQLVSLSPELFLRRCGDMVETRPMKGTAARRPGWAEDEAARRALALDAKNRAENVMIVDLMRNDLGRVCVPGGVAVPRLFEVARYASVHQMTSTVVGRLRGGVGLVELLAATFPPGSVTGAPKVRATQMIAALETTPRGVYCGALGVVFPGGDLLLNVAIRTLVCRARGATFDAVLGVGSGIVYDADPAREWDECAAKGRFVAARRCPFDLLETLRHDPADGFAWLVDHLRRLRASARYFGRRWDAGAVIAALRAARRQLPPAAARVQLLLDETGAPRAEYAGAPRDWPAGGARAYLAPDPVQADDVYMHHKTTRRDVYDAALRAAAAAGCDEALLRNERGELTEGCVSSVFVLRDDGWVTPAAACGVLPGVWRQRVLRALSAREDRIAVAELAQARAVVVGNSVRGGCVVRALVHPNGTTQTLPPSPDIPAPVLGPPGWR